MKIEKSKIKLYATLGSRATFGMLVLELKKKYEKLFIVTADVSTSAGLDRYRKQHKDSYLDVGISEQNMIGVATGLATEGFDVITTTFSPFQTARCCEQIKVNLGYMENKVCMVGLASGLVLGNLGYTHCSIEDIGILRSIPNISIVSPADGMEIAKCLDYVISKSKNSVYIRLTGDKNEKPIYENDYDFTIGKGVKILEGSDITFFSCGSILNRVIDTAKKLELEKNISCSVINMHTIKPIDNELIIEEAKKSKMLISVEEHNIIGGLGSSISEVISGVNKSPKLLRIGINDKYISEGGYEHLLNKYSLNSAAISEKVYEEFRKI